MSKKAIIIIVSIACVLLILVLLGLRFMLGIFHRGNNNKYSVKNETAISNSALAGKTYYFLGSSVTLGSASHKESMADFLAKRNNCTVVKEAVGGTKLADSKNSYVKRIENFDTSIAPDALICQLSTNDLKFKNKGVVSNSFNPDELDISTTYGAIEYIAWYVQETFGCPLIFYTNAYIDYEKYSTEYSVMIDTLKIIAEKWEFLVLDLFNDTEFNNLTKEQKKLYLNDPIHPTRAGYKEWYTPKFESFLASKVNLLSKDI